MQRSREARSEEGKGRGGAKRTINWREEAGSTKEKRTGNRELYEIGVKRKANQRGKERGRKEMLPANVKKKNRQGGWGRRNIPWREDEPARNG